MFRLATAADYEYLPEIGLYELTFDKRPVQGVRCENPEQGAQQYNACQQRVKTARNKERQRKRNFTPLTELSWNGVMDWCIAKGTSEECQLVLACYHARDKAQRNDLWLAMKQHYGLFRETNAWIMIGLFNISGSHLADADKIQLVMNKAGTDEN
ncbi:hypothetical protein [Providencia rettgeri]|uniref:hypothetical protein n=1 Tax=Providencia rettgeri TaxID=587 RepID=UPI00141A4233|nr:hypothetical protein [Providencia rettgeri]NIH07046.1 hypothetical protein [Providencia rettgeri]